MRNQSTPGAILLSAKQTFDTGPIPYDLFAADGDGDGKTDILTLNQGGNSFSALRNISPNVGSIQFAPRKHDFGTGYSPYRMSVADIDGDQKPDVVTANNPNDTVSLVINQSSVGEFDFKTRLDYPSASRATISNVAAADLDRDGDLDIGVSYFRQNVYVFSVYQNDGSGRFPVRKDINP